MKYLNLSLMFFAVLIFTKLNAQINYSIPYSFTTYSKNLNYPTGVAVDSSGTIYVADNFSIKKIATDGTISILAGNPAQSGSADGTGSSARFNSACAIALDSTGNIYVTDQYNNTIRKITQSGLVTTIAGQAGISGSKDGIGNAALFNQPLGIAVSSTGTIYVADSLNSTIRAISQSGVVTTYAGTAGKSGFIDGSTSSALFEGPIGLAIDSIGNLYVADSALCTIRKISSSGVVSTLAGSMVWGEVDGNGSNAHFQYPRGIAVNSTGTTIYVGDTSSDTVRMIDSANNVTTIGGSYLTNGNVDGIGKNALFRGTGGVAIGPSGEIYIADINNFSIKKGVLATPILISNTTIGATAGTSFLYTPTFTGGNISSYSASGLPTGLSINPINGTISGTVSAPVGSYSANLIATNAAGQSSTKITINVYSSGYITAVKFINPPTQIIISQKYEPSVEVDYQDGTKSINPPDLITSESTGLLNKIGNLFCGARSGNTNITASIGAVTSSINIYVNPYEVIDNPDSFLTTPASGYRILVPVVVINYFPTVDGVNLDINRAPWYGDNSTLTQVKIRASDTQKLTKFAIEEGSKFRSYGRTNINPEVGIKVVKYVNVYETNYINTNSGSYVATGTASGEGSASGDNIPDVRTIFSNIGLQNLVNNTGVKEVWFDLFPLSSEYGQVAQSNIPQSLLINFWESYMSSPTTGNISNSDRNNTVLPVYNSTYVVYGYNLARTQAENIHNRGHQIEAQMDYIDQSARGTGKQMFWNYFVGYPLNGTPTGRCGDTHFPPNGTSDYDWNDTVPVLSDITTWQPLGGTKIAVDKSLWMSPSYNYPSQGTFTNSSLDNDPQYKWLIYWFQSIPGYGNNIPYNGSVISDWWDIFYNWDSANLKNRTLWQSSTSVVVPGAPQNVSVAVGNAQASVSFVAPSTNGGSAILNYTVTATPVTGGASVSTTANSSTILVTGLVNGLEYTFQVTATNSAGVGSPYITATTYTPIAVVSPLITTQPTSQTINSGSSTTFSVTVTGTSPTYQWYYNGTAITGATSSSYSITSATSSNAGSYYVVVSNSAGSVQSSTVTLTVNASIVAPVILTQPQSLTVTSGNSTTFSVTGYGVSLSYQWYLNNIAIPGATSATYTIASVTSASAGSYTVKATNGGGSITSNAAVLTVISNPGRLINLSVLSMDGPGSQLLTIGFVTGGAGTTGSENLLIRGSGPALAAFSLTNYLPDPSITVFNSSTVAVAANDNWGTPPSNATAVTSADTATGAFALTSTSSLDAALVTNLSSGAYTAQVSGKGTASGFALAEVYDNTPTGSYTPATPRLVNISCLEQISVGGSLTAGFVIAGSTPEQVLIRASGPTLAAAPFNVSGTIADPELTVYNSSSTVLATNKGWGGSASITAANNATGAFQFVNSTSKDSAVLLTLQPGAYTVQATSASGIAGLTLIEVYEVPASF